MEWLKRSLLVIHGHVNIINQFVLKRNNIFLAKRIIILSLIKMANKIIRYNLHQQMKTANKRKCQKFTIYTHALSKVHTDYGESLLVLLMYPHSDKDLILHTHLLHYKYCVRLIQIKTRV